MVDGIQLYVTISVYHPDIYEFINAKSQDANALKHFNLSVIVDDAFMKAVEDGNDIELHWPVYDERGNKVPREQWNPQFTRSVSATELWDAIMKKAYDNGEPGFFFEDTLQQRNPANYIENIVASNPCFTGDMRLLTTDGYKRFDELVGRDDVSVLSYDGSISHNNRVWCSGHKDIIAVTFSDGTTIKCTPNHVFMLEDGSEMEASRLVGHTVKVADTPLAISGLVVKVEAAGTTDVYDFTEHTNHWGIVEDRVVHNCSEYLAGTIKREDCNPQDFGGACNLGSLYLHKFVRDPFTKDAKFDWENFFDTIEVAIRMLDDIIDVNKFPNKIYENYQKNMRTIGLGYTGLADMLAMLGIRYNSQEALDFVETLMSEAVNCAYAASARLAKERGPFAFCNNEAHASSWFAQNNLDSVVLASIREFGIRNAKIQAVAPAGTTSIVYGNNCSSGIEPIFQLDYERKVKIGGQDEDNIKIVHMTDYAYKIWQDMGSPEEFKDVWVTALDMSVDEHVGMLATIAKHVDMSVSKTINVPTDYPFDKAKDVYMQCWKLGVKGCTIFRPNEIRQGILIANGNHEKTQEQSCETCSIDDLDRGAIIGVNDDLMSIKKTIVNGCGKFYLHVDFDEDSMEFLETYIDIGSGGGCERNLQFISRLISLALRAGVPLEAIIDQAYSIRPCNAYVARTRSKHDTSPGTSCPSAIGKALEDMQKKAIALYGDPDTEDAVQQIQKQDEPVTAQSALERLQAAMPKCPECGNPLVAESGCLRCDCGWSKCG